MLEIEFSKHAQARMLERNIPENEIIEALTLPTQIKSGKGEKFIAKKNGIRVVYAVKNGKILVVTVTQE